MKAVLTNQKQLEIDFEDLFRFINTFKCLQDIPAIESWVNNYKFPELNFSLGTKLYIGLIFQNLND